MEKQELESLDANFRASNYLAAAQLFLKSNVDLNNLALDDLKESVFGHWGCCPGINYSYTHINRFMCKTQTLLNLIIGTGHSSPALISNLYINGVLGKSYLEYQYGIGGINNIIKGFGKNMLLQTEISPLLPNVILAGGELGNAISVSFGTVLNNPRQTTFVIVGDGEMEAGTSLPSLLCNQIINPQHDGFLVIIVNLNKYKMTSRSLISLNEYIKKMFFSFGFEVFTTSINSHEQTAKIFDRIIDLQTKWYNGRNIKLPFIILESQKGFSAPEIIGSKRFLNSHLSHKVSSLRNPSNENLEIIRKWLKSYKPEELFFEGVPTNQVLSNIPKQCEILYNTTCFNSKSNVYNISTLNIMETLTKYFLNYTDSNFLIFSPDESISNGLNEFVQEHGIRCRDENIESSINVKNNGRVIEILNEVMCLSMLYGYIKIGRDGIFITYEAFSPLVSSFISQCYKFYKMQRENNKLEGTKSLKIILTSLGWRNTYTHQNPDLLNTLLAKTSDSLEIYFPSESNQALVCFQEIENQMDSIQVLYVSKTELQTRRTLKQAKEDVKKGFWMKNYEKSQGADRVLIISIGDVITNECLIACEEVESRNIDLLTVLKASTLDTLKINQEKYVKILVYFSGYCDILQGKLSKQNDTSKWQFFGYNDSIYGSFKNVLQSNCVDKNSIANAIKEDLYEL